MNRIAVDSIEKAGVLIDLVIIEQSKEFFRLIPRTKGLTLIYVTFPFCNQVEKEIETYTELPHLKVMTCYNEVFAHAILKRSQLEQFSLHEIKNEKCLLELLAK